MHTDERHDERRANYVVLEARFDALDEKVDRLRDLLEGNGQPGFISKTNEHLAALDAFKWKLIGGFSIFGVLVTILNLVILLRKAS